MFDEQSRYKHATIIRRDDNVLYLSLRPRISYFGGYDEILHKVLLGDTLHNIASRYYNAFPDAADLWWIIADFQPEPINDPTVRLEPGSWIVVPAPDTVQSWLMSVTDGQAGAF